MIAPSSIQVSVIVLNYNGRHYLRKCLDSIDQQTISAGLEVIIPDNGSSDGSDLIAAEWSKNRPRTVFFRNGANLGYCGGNNRGAQIARGRFLFFLNNDAWLEPDCLEVLLREVDSRMADAATPIVQNFTDNTFQSLGCPGFDWFGMCATKQCVTHTCELFAACGCSLFVNRRLFDHVGGFDESFFMYSDETDLAWRIWIAGGSIIGVPDAKVHHRVHGNTDLGQPPQIHTQKRYLANRNGILFLAKNAQHILLLLLIPHVFHLLAEGLLIQLVFRQRGVLYSAYVKAVLDAFSASHGVSAWRRQIADFRVRGDFWMLRFIEMKPARLNAVQQLWIGTWKRIRDRFD